MNNLSEHQDNFYLHFKLDESFGFFLPKVTNKNDLKIKLNRRASVKDIIESIGIPHTEIGALYFDGNIIDFSFIPEKSGQIEIKPIPTPYDVRKPCLLRPDPFPDFKFIADVNVIRLGRLIILLGFDVTYDNTFTDSQIADLAEKEKRIVLTRDTRLLMRNQVIFGRRIQSDLPYDQLKEVISFFGLKFAHSFFSRCTTCNVKLIQVEKNKIIHELEPKTKKYFDIFYQCPNCEQIFWKGSHHDNILHRLAENGINI